MRSTATADRNRLCATRTRAPAISPIGVPFSTPSDLAARHLEAPARGEDGEAPRVVGVEEEAAELDPVKGRRLELARGICLGHHPHAAHLEVHGVAARQQQGAPQLERRVEALEQGPARRRSRARRRRRDQDSQVADRRAALDELEEVRPRLRSERLVAEEALRCSCSPRGRAAPSGPWPARPRRGASPGSPSRAGSPSRRRRRRGARCRSPVSPEQVSSASCSAAVSSPPLGARQEPDWARAVTGAPATARAVSHGRQAAVAAFAMRCMGPSWLAGHGGGDPRGSYQGSPVSAVRESVADGASGPPRPDRGAAGGAEVLVQLAVGQHEQQPLAHRPRPAGSGRRRAPRPGAPRTGRAVLRGVASCLWCSQPQGAVKARGAVGRPCPTPDRLRARRSRRRASKRVERG